ncbi:Transposable element Tc1 transposase [Araneus ventricosus]|uniref:Transposable element Tc1 transposase n=1 Tax=Araneus ventricosus TaxID=182803 RepID=A0A4Y2BVI8_ARAVE|nr:Transposable element Tc1 transposase [Araneus ventricosus]
MARSRKETTIGIRKLIIFHHRSGKSVRNIAKLVHLSSSTVQYVIKRCKRRKSDRKQGKKRSTGQVNKTSPRFIIRKFLKNACLSALKVSAEFNEKFSTSISPETVRQILRAAGLNGRSARRIFFFVSAKSRKLRLSFAKSMLNKLETHWNNVLFADENKFNIFSSDRRIKVWRRKNEELNPKNLVGTVKYGGGCVLVWGCMSASGLGNLVFFDGIMNHDLYLNILRDNLKLTAQNLDIGNNFVFDQDNDPKHRALNVRLWCLYKSLQILKTPPQSPDVNPIEHIWRELEVRIRKHDIKTNSELKTVITEEWMNIDAEITKKLVKSIPKRLKAVVDAKGYPPKY